jgi:hypothetical protein
MSEAMPLTSEEVTLLAVLANGIIPADERDAGAAAVNAGARLAAGASAAHYLPALKCAAALAAEQFGRSAAELNPGEVHALLDAFRQRYPGHFALLRKDVCALYLSDPAVWRRIGFPGPSTSQGGYPDFDRPQS